MSEVSVKTCRRGHPMTPENSKHKKSGQISCRTCLRASEERRRSQYKRPEGVLSSAEIKRL